MAEPLELPSLLDEHGVSLLEGSLLVHGLGDLFAHLLGHLLAHVLLQLVQELQLGHELHRNQPNFA